jgi:hypothetical protein
MTTMIPVRITLAIGLPDHTWIEKVVHMEMSEAQIDEEHDYPFREHAFDWLMKHEADWLNSLQPTFWTDIHIEFIESDEQ